jgi:RNA ligase (TIGR02306 family)
MTRQLATILRIKEIKEIEGADRISCAAVEGWKCVVNKNEFNAGDLVVYCEIDSVLPEWKEFDFLKQSLIDNGVVRGYRIRTRKFRKQVSQGLILPISILNGRKYKNDNRENPTYEFTEGKDVTELLEIQKFERPIPICLQGKVKGDFPEFIPKTDETRINVLQNLLDQYKGTKCYITEKLDGSSSTFYIKDGEFGVCSRNLELAKEDVTYHEFPPYTKRIDGKYQLVDNNGNLYGEVLDTPPERPNIKENVYWKIAHEYIIEERLRQLGRELAIQGEIVGEGIQGNPLRIKGNKLYIFNMFDITDNRYLSLKEMKDIINKTLYCKSCSLKCSASDCECLCHNYLELVPILTEEFMLINDIDKIVEMAKGNSVINNVKREGIVIRPVEDIYDNNYGEVCKFKRISFKSINNEYLLEEQ